MVRFLMQILIFISIGVLFASIADGVGSGYNHQPLLQMLAKTFQKNNAVNFQDIDGNAYIDQVLADMHDEIMAQHLDPYKVEDINVLGVQTEGYIGGFSTMHRSGDASVTETETELMITVDLAIINLEGDFNWTYSFLSIDYNGDADAMVDTVDLYLSLQGPIIAGSTSVTLVIEALDVQNIGRITVEVHGFGIFDEIIDIISQAIANLVSGLIPYVIDNICRVILNGVIEDYPFPLPEAAI